MKVNCFTNLDLGPAEKWPSQFPVLPNVGDHIRSKQKWENDFRLTLEVKKITWVPREAMGQTIWEPEIELHFPSHWKLSIKEFYEWYAPKVGRSVGHFI